MGWKETLINAGEDVVSTAARVIANELLGRIFDGHDSHTAQAAKRVAEAATKAALDAAELEARNGIAAHLLPDRMRELADQIARDMAHAFEPPAEPTVPHLDVDIEIEPSGR